MSSRKTTSPTLWSCAAAAGEDTVVGFLFRPAGQPGSVAQPSLRLSYQPGVCPRFSVPLHPAGRTGFVRAGRPANETEANQYRTPIFR